LAGFVWDEVWKRYQRNGTMEILVLLASVTMLVLLLAAVKGYRGLKIILLFLSVISAAGWIFFNNSSDDINGTEFISSFLSGLTFNEEKNEVLAVTPPDEVKPQWKVYNGHLADIRHEGNSFSFSPKEESIWWRRSKGLLVYRYAEGDFFFSSLVRTRKNSDTLKYPDDAWQFGGIMLRDPSAEQSQESYILIAVGSMDSALMIEIKSTIQGVTTKSNFRWLSGDAELMIQREAGVFGMCVRPYGTAARWTRLTTYYRPDLPVKLQAGIMAYAFSYGRNVHDMTAYFDDVKIRRENE